MHVFAVGDFIVAIHSTYGDINRVEVAALTGNRELIVQQMEPRGFVWDDDLLAHLVRKMGQSPGMQPAVIVGI